MTDRGAMKEISLRKNDTILNEILYEACVVNGQRTSAGLSLPPSLAFFSLPSGKKSRLFRGRHKKREKTQSEESNERNGEKETIFAKRMTKNENEKKRSREIERERDQKNKEKRTTSTFFVVHTRRETERRNDPMKRTIKEYIS